MCRDRKFITALIALLLCAIVTPLSLADEHEWTEPSAEAIILEAEEEGAPSDEDQSDAPAQAADGEAIDGEAADAAPDAETPAEPGEESGAEPDGEAVPEADADGAEEEVSVAPVEESLEGDEFELTAVNGEAEAEALEAEAAAEAEALFVDLEPIEPEELVAYPTIGLSNDEAVNGYIESVMYAPLRQDVSLEARALAGARLGEGTPERRLYDKLCPLVKEVALGGQDSTIFTFSLKDLYDNVAYTAADLGLDTLTVNGQITLGAALGFHSRVDINLTRVLNALMADMPYEMYWYDKTCGTYYSYPDYVYQDGVMRIRDYDSGTLSYKFCVAPEYSADGGTKTFSANKGKCASVPTAVNRAQAIVETYSALGDYAKLRAYKEEICALVSYNHNTSGVDYGNPWQLVWVFDGDDSTNVVCEGYAKAFQYLCDLSTFDKRIDVISVIGNLGNSSGGGGRHMWNNVTIKGVTYLADLTNCDSGTVGYPDRLFLKGYSYKDQYAYYFELPSRTVNYIYDAKYVDLFGGDALEFDDNAAGPAETAAFYGSIEGTELSWTLSAEGVLYVSGRGDVPDYAVDAPAPWCDTEEKRELIQMVYLGAGITGLGDCAFYGCENLNRVTVGPNTTRFGAEIFTGTDMYVKEGEKNKDATFIIRDCRNRAAIEYADAMLQSHLLLYSLTHGSITTYQAVAPTCTATGLTAGSHCAKCGEVILEQEVVPATGHTVVSDAAVAPTCTATGLTAGSHCAKCGEVIVKQSVIPAKGHSPVAVPGVAPTYTSTGLSEGSRCAVCNATLSAQQTLPALVYTVHMSGNASTSVDKGTPVQIVVDNKQVKSYASSNKKVATVSKTGVVTTRKAGTAKITVKLKNNKKVTLKVKVVDPTVAKSVKILQGKTAKVKVGQTLQLTSALTPATAVNGVKWKSSNKKIATVDSQGRVTAKKAGKVKITVVTSNKKKATITLRVVK